MADLQTAGKSGVRKRIIRNTGLAFIAVTLLLTFFSKTINNLLLPEVEYTVIRSGKLTQEINSKGEVCPLNIENISCYGNWEILDVRVGERDEFLEGDVLAVIDTGDISLEIKKSELALLKMENELERYKNGFQPIDLEEYAQDAEVALKAVGQAKKALAAEESLYDGGAVPLESVNNARDSLDSAERKYADKKKLLARKQTERQRLEDDYSRTVKEKAAEIELYSLELEEKKKNSPEDGLLRAPFDGVVKAAFIQKGASFVGGQVLFETVKREEGLCVKWTLGLPAAEEVDKNDAVIFTEADGKKNSFKGTVNEKKFIRGESRYEFVGHIKEAEGELEIGQKLDVSIVKSSVSYPMLIPNSSVIRENGKDYMFIVKEREGVLGKENYVERYEVEVLDTDAFNSAITSIEAITGNDKIVSFSSKALSDKIQVKLG
ncbi:hypothetical protein DFR58_11512 [Anaerobacterium chartisolvens]|uniref:HlyD family secretion protein n=1 Tax=Anaerobacterium chartisolvens TaxID=1297424 RepID=A0A369AYD5_9FIRM|nr:hypothetical protein [Anaerobacterium chartisolvens]RCX14289.1 hypothetical protein DFR58_11512 [Anaerobacterium chartisolvens]